MSDKKPQPIERLRDGRIKATIWRNEGDKGAFFTTEFTRTYRNGDGYKDSRSFSGTDLLKLSRLAQIAYDAEQELRTAERGDNDDDQDEGGEA